MLLTVSVYKCSLFLCERGFFILQREEEKNKSSIVEIELSQAVSRFYLRY